MNDEEDDEESMWGMGLAPIKKEGKAVKYSPLATDALSFEPEPVTLTETTESDVKKLIKSNLGTTESLEDTDYHHIVRIYSKNSIVTITHQLDEEKCERIRTTIWNPKHEDEKLHFEFNYQGTLNATLIYIESRDVDLF